jgi:hypothetical protein
MDAEGRHLRLRKAQPGTRQRGVVAIIVALSLAVMLGFVGLAIDGGRLYLTKTELQNAADACALAASYELTDAPTIPADAFTRAEAAGRTVGSLNKVGFQGAAIATSDISLTYSATLASGWAGAGAPPAADAKYVRCTIQKTGIQPYFMQVLGIGNQTVNAFATATLAPAQTNCAVPMALCVRGAAPDYGYVAGDWIGMDFRQTGNGQDVDNYSGNFRWIDYSPGQPSPNCGNSQGAPELTCLLAGSGSCNLPEPITTNCTGTGSNVEPGCVGATGAINSIERAYNTRFGVYANGGGYSVANAPPDFTGFSYSTENWTPANNAYAGSVGGQSNYKAARAARLAIQADRNITNPPLYANNDTLATQAQHVSNGADRRLVVVPVVECANFASSQTGAVRAYACVLMLDPYRRQGNDVVSRLEYLGRSDAAGSPCASSGIAGNATSQGPLVPALVQ